MPDLSVSSYQSFAMLGYGATLAIGVLVFLHLPAMYPCSVKNFTSR